MKIDRLLGIVMILLQKERVTAPYLAEKFEVSRRTINRDIEALCMAGIPVITAQGGKGGITIAEGYRVDKSVLTYEEMQAVIAGLKGIDSISADEKSERLLSKFFLHKDNVVSPRDSIIIDLSSHYKSGLTQKIALIKEAIRSNSFISFRYYSSKGEMLRLIEPYYLTFQWSAWYVFGYCTERKDFRLFKLNRVWELVNTCERFEPRDIPEDRKEFSNYFTDQFKVKVIFDERVKYRLIDEYGVDGFTRLDNGKLNFEMGFTNREYFISWILGYGDMAEVLEPKEIRNEIKEITEKISKQYQ